ncbi:MAG: protein kinase [Chthoniobacteraceae bacterium]
MLIPETEIIISRDGAELARTTVRPGDYVIGCHAEAEINVVAEGVAERHAQLTVNYHELFIEDLGSDSGTFVGGKRIAESTRLWPTQKVQIGSVVIETRKVKSATDSDQSLAPDAATVRRVLPEEFLRARKYEIGGLIAQGGMGAILDAHEATTQRTVAMKVMLASMSEGDVLRFIEEAQITSQLEHPNIVPVHELGVDEHDQVFYTMKLVQGVTLRQVLEKLRAGDAATVAAYPLRRLLIVLMRVCDAMAFAHSRGVIHRDLKPDNVMIGDFGEVLVMDWGLAKVLGGTRSVASHDRGPDGAGPSTASLSGSVRSVREGEDTEFTMAGSIVGTPHYMSPEQARGESETLEEGSDIWALGAILRHLLTLEKPVPGETVDEVIENVRAGRLTPIPPRAAHCPGGRVPEALTAVMAKAQALRREDRYATVEQFREEIDAWLGGFATKAEQAGLAKQLALLIQRHKGIFSTAAAAWLLITALAVWFVVNLRAKERRAAAGEQKAVAAEAVAKAEKETARQALAKSQLDLAEKEFERGKFVEAQKIIEETPESLRDANWRFLRAHARDFTAQLTIPGKGGTFRLQVLPQGDRFAVRCYSGAVGIFTLTGRQIGNWFPVIADIWGTFGIDGAGSRLALAASANEVAVYDVATGKPMHRWTCEIGQIKDVLLSPDGGTVLVAGGNQLIACVTETGVPRWKQTYSGVIPAFSPDGRTVAILAAKESKESLNLKVQLLATDTGAVRRTLEATADHAEQSSLHFNQAGDQLACLGGDEAILWNPRTGLKVRTLHFSGERVQLLSPKGGAVATFSGSRIRLWDTTTGRPLRSLNGAGTNAVSPAFSLDGKVLLSSHASGDGGIIHAWPTRLAEEIATVRPSGYQASRVVFDRDGSRFYAAARNVAVGETRSGLEKWKFATQRTDVNDLDVHPTDGAIILSRQGQRAFAHVSSTGEDLPALGAASNSSVKFNRAGQLLLTVDGAFAFTNPGGSFSVLEYPSGNVLRKIPLENPRQPFAAFCLDDAAVATAALAGGITVWDWKAGTPLRQIAAAQTGSIACLASSPDGRHLATGGPDRWIRVWEAATGRLESVFRAHWEGVRCVKFSLDGREILSGSEDGTVRINDAATGEERLAFYGLTTPVVDVDLSADGTLIAAITEDGFTKVWDRQLSSAAALLPKRPAANPPEVANAANGWEDLFARLTPAEVEKTGHGWSLKDGELFSPDTKGAAKLPLPGEVSGTSYRVRIKLRQLPAKDVFHVILPVGDRMTGFELDGFAGKYTGLNAVNGTQGKNLPGVVEGKQVNDAEPHELEVTVRLDGTSATITTTLDTLPLYEWTGPTAALSQARVWATTKLGALALGTYAGGWAVSEVKVKRLDAGK